MKHPSPHKPINSFTIISLSLRSGQAFLLLFTFSFLLMTCSKKGTDPGEETVTFSGKVTLEGQTDHSGVTIALYKPVELDTALVRINQQYPNIGVQISQETEFDHREHTPVVTTVSDAGGNWKIENVAQGEYNVVASKDGFGWIIEYTQNITGDKTLTFGPLKNGLFLSGNISSDVILADGQFVYFEENAYVPQNVKIVVGKNNTFVFGNNKQLLIAGDFILSTNSSLNITSFDINAYGEGIILDKSTTNVLLTNIHANYIDKPFTLNPKPGLQVSLSNVYVNNCNTGVLAKNPSIVVSNSLFRNIATNALEILSDFQISRCVFYNEAKVFLNDRDGVVQNCNFHKNTIAMVPYQGNIEIKQNLFSNNEIAVAINSDNCAIIYNDFNSNRLDLEMNRNYVQGATINYSNPVVNFNNFFSSDTVVNIFGKNSLYAGGFYGGVGINKNIEIKNCYWQTTDNFTLNQRIFDASDIPTYNYFILSEPAENSPLTNTGPQ